MLVTVMVTRKLQPNLKSARKNSLLQHQHEVAVCSQVWGLWWADQNSLAGCGPTHLVVRVLELDKDLRKHEFAHRTGNAISRWLLHSTRNHRLYSAETQVHPAHNNLLAAHLKHQSLQSLCRLTHCEISADDVWREVGAKPEHGRGDEDRCVGQALRQTLTDVRVAQMCFTCARYSLHSGQGHSIHIRA